jgi:hypothetical protein
MITLPRTRDFSARLLAKQQPERGPLIGVYMMFMFFRAEQTAAPFGNQSYAESDKTARRRFKTSRVP